MAISLFNEERAYSLNHIRSKPFKGGYLVTTDYGSWAYLTQDEFELLKKEKLKENSELFSMLKDKGIVLTGENINRVVEDYRNRMSYLFQGTSLHIVVVTLRCNHKCVYCHSAVKGEHAQGYDMDEETARKTADFIFQSPSKAIAIEFQGGEPLLNFPIIKFIIMYAREKNLKHRKNLAFRLVTNLTLMTDEILNYLIKERVEISSSLDGPAVVHNENRKYVKSNGSHEEVVSWIDNIQKRYNVNVMSVVTKHSLPYAKEIIDEFRKHNLRTIFLKYVNPVGFGKSRYNDIAPSATEFLEFWKKSVDYLLSLDDGPREIMTVIILKKILSKQDAFYTDLQGPCCGAAIGQICYNHNGNIFTCDEAKIYDVFRIVTVEQTYKEVVTSRQACALLEASMNDHPFLDKEVYKPYLGLCPVVNYAKTGSVITRFPNDRIAMFSGVLDYIFEKLLFDPKAREKLLRWANF